MKSYVVLFIYIAIVLSAYAQDNCVLMHDANWIWEASDTADLKRTTVQISFTQDTYVIDTMKRSMEIGSQNCTMSDEDGNLLFYSNGCFIANSQDAPIVNSDTLNPGIIFNTQCRGRDGSYIGSQGMIALPAPFNDSIYYIFHKKYEFLDEPSFHLVVDQIYVTTVNPFQNLGQGKVLEKNIAIVSDTNILSSHFTATRHADGECWWVITHTAYGNGFYRILLDHSGIVQQEIQLIGGNTLPDISAGQSKFSPDGSKLAMYHSKSGVYLFDFDRSSGLLSNYQAFGPIDSAFIIGGCEFSPSGRFLYVNTMRDVYQYDMEAEDIPASEVHLGHYDGYLSPFATLFYHMERTPNGQIFMNCPNQVNVLHVIEEPDKQGLACNFRQHGIILPAHIFWSMPHFPNYRLGAMEDPPCDTTVSITVDPIRGEIRVYPNPVRDVLHVETTIPMESVHLYDLSGKRLAHWKNSSTFLKFSMSEFDPGMYIIEIVLIDKSRLSAKVVYQ